MRKTEALAKAKAKLQYGHYAGTAGRPYTYCPDCEERVGAFPHPWDKGATRMRLLRDALVEHLIDYCEGKVR